MARMHQWLALILTVVLLAMPLNGMTEGDAVTDSGYEAIVAETEAFELDAVEDDAANLEEAPSEIDTFDLAEEPEQALAPESEEEAETVSETEPEAEAVPEAEAAAGLIFRSADAVLLLGSACPALTLFQRGDGAPLDSSDDLSVEIADSAVAMLDDQGDIAALAAGVTAICGTLPDGSRAEGLLTVVDPEAVGVEYVGEKPSKPYDGSADFVLHPMEFRPNAAARAMGMDVSDVQALADGAEAGERLLTVEVVLSGGDASLRTVRLALEAEITPLPIDAIPGFADPFATGGEDLESCAYTGQPICPAAVAPRLGDVPLRENVDYRVTYADNVLPGTAVATMAGLGNFCGSFTHTFAIVPVAIDQPEIVQALESVRNGEYPWTDEPVCPGFTLNYGGMELVRDRDYRVSFAGNDAPGGALMTIAGIGGFTGTIEVPFTILEPEAVANTSVPEKLELGVGETYQLPVSGSGMAFASKNKKIAVVSAGGVVKGVKKGSTVIAVRNAKGSVVTIPVAVKKKPTKLTLSAKALTLSVGQTQQLTARLSPSGCRNVLTWTSSDASVVKVVDGTLTALKTGKATITARTYNNIKAKCTVTVVVAPEDVTLSPAEASLPVKGTLTLKAVVSPAGALATLRYSSSNTAVATVSSKGKITAKKAGTAVITVTTVNGKTAQCKLTVTKAPGKLTMSQSTATLAKGMTLQLSAKSDIDDHPTLAWSSSDNKIATVSQSGLVTAKKAGTVTIKAVTANGKKATCKVTVKALPKSVTVRAAKNTLSVGESTRAYAKLTKNTWSPIEWSVEGDAVTVDQSGNITAVKAGTAKVLATATAAYIAGSVTITVRGSGGDDPAPGGKLIIDISKWQGNINFDKVKPKVSLVICRATCATSADTMFATYAKAMNDRSMPFGVYCYSHASDAASARKEARYLYSVASKYKPKFYVLDAEEASLNQEAITAFVAELRSLGVKKVGAYVAHHRYTSYGFASLKSLYDFVWIPRYGGNDGTVASAVKPAYPCDLWQYSSKGRVAGITGDVDVNVITGQGKKLSWFVS